MHIYVNMLHTYRYDIEKKNVVPTPSEWRCSTPHAMFRQKFNIHSRCSLATLLISLSQSFSCISQYSKSITGPAMFSWPTHLNASHDRSLARLDGIQLPASFRRLHKTPPVFIPSVLPSSMAPISRTTFKCGVSFLSKAIFSDIRS